MHTRVNAQGAECNNVSQRTFVDRGTFNNTLNAVSPAVPRRATGSCLVRSLGIEDAHERARRNQVNN